MKKNIMLIFILFFCLSVSALTQITVGYYDNPPKIYKDKLSGQAEGFWADITNEIGKDANVEINWVFGSWTENLKRLELGQIDVVFDIAETESRKEKLLFTKESALLSWSTIYINPKTEVNSLLDFQDKTIGVMVASVNYKSKAGIVELFTSFDITPEFVEFDSYSQVLDAVSSGQIFGGVTSKDIGAYYMKDGLVNATPFWFQPNHLKYAVSIKNPRSSEIINLLDKYIYNYKKDATSIYYEAISNHLDGINTNTFPQWAKLLLIVLLAVIVSFYLFNRILSAKVKEQTKTLLEEIEKKELIQKNLIETKDKLASMNKIKDNFLRSVSHELLTPLNAILGFSDVLCTNNEEITPDLRYEYLKKIHNSGIKLLKIVNDMLDVTLLNSNLISLRNDPVVIYNLVLDLFNNYPKDDKLAYTLVIPDNYDKTNTIVTDEDKLTKILVYLLDNATKFTDSGEIILGYTVEDGIITFFVKDSGIGISDEDKERIFNGFTQIDSIKGRVSHGAGLGLAIVHALVKSLHGEIFVESSLNQGSAFLVKLPLNLNSKFFKN